MKNIVIIGATSLIAEKVAQQYARVHCRFYLFARNDAKLSLIANDLRVRGATEVETYHWDAGVSDVNVILDVINNLPQVALLLVAHGVISDKKDCDTALESFNVNVTSIITLLHKLIPYYEKRRQGTIAVISSVAGDRIRAQVHLYGAAKAGLSAYLQGLRQRLFPHHVHVLTIKPGPVNTPMTQGTYPEAILADPEKVALDIIKAIDKRRNTVYTPGIWRWIMLIIRLIPEALWKRL
jgi:decaprenylphospho-beta-D-erythro-pentofuranosid-2-ulose 2-reductase